MEITSSSFIMEFLVKPIKNGISKLTIVKYFQDAILILFIFARISF